MSLENNQTDTGAADGAAKAAAGTVAADAVAAKPDQAAAAAAGTVAADGKAAKASKGKPTTVADEGATKDDRVTATTFPDTWRKDLAGDDEKLLKRLERLADPKGLLDWALNAEKKIGKTAPKPGKDAPPEEQKAWREANGIPETPDKYDLKLKDNKALGDEDKPVFERFAKAAHEAGMNSGQMSAMVDAYLELVGTEQNGIMEGDENALAETVRELKEEWGPADYKRNIAAVTGLFADAPKGTMEMVLGARMENGRKIGGDAGALKFLAKLALEVNPAATYIPDGDQSGKGLEGQIAEIEKVMQTDNRKYWSDAAMQKRYGELLVARDKMQARGQKAA